MKELRLTITNPGFGLTIEPKTAKEEKSWKDNDSPIAFIVSMDLTKKKPFQPEIREVEVLRVQETLKEVVNERVVYHGDDGVEAPKPNVGLDDADMRAYIEIAVEEALANRLGAMRHDHEATIEKGPDGSVTVRDGVVTNDVLRRLSQMSSDH